MTALPPGYTVIGGVLHLDGVPVPLPKPPPTERFGRWLIKKIGKTFLRLQKHPKALGRIVAWGAPLIGMAGTAVGLPPGTTTAILTAAKALAQAFGGDLPACE